MIRWRKTAAVPTALGLALCAVLAAAGPGTGGLVASARAQDAGVTLDDVTLPFGGLTLKVPKAEIQGSPLSQADLRALLAGSEPWPERLRRLDARAIVMPVLRVEQATDQGVQVAVYRDVVARDVVRGRIGRLDSAGAVLSVEGPTAPPGAGTYGKVSAEGLDLTALARLMTETGGADAPALRVCDAFETRDIVLTGREGVSARVAAVAGRDLGGRPTATPWGETTRRLAEAGPEERGRLTGLAADLLGAVAIGHLEMRGLSLIDAAKDGTTRVDLARLALDGGTSAPVATAAEFRFDGPAGRIGLASASVSEISLAPALDGLRRLSSPTPPDAEELRRYVPLLGHVEFAGLDVDLPAQAQEPGQEAKPGKETKPGQASKPDERLRFGLRKAALDTRTPRDGIPTAARLALDGLAFAVPPGSAAPVVSQLAALGYPSVDLSGVIETSWDAAAREVAVKDLTVTGKDMGTARVTATLGGIGPEVLNPNPTVASLALLGASARSLALTIENGGLFERFVNGQAKAQSLKPAELQQEYGTAATLGIPAVLGNSAAAKALGQAVARFVTHPGRLTVTATAKDPAGLGLLDVSAAGSPGKVFDRLNVTATAE